MPKTFFDKYRYHLLLLLIGWLWMQLFDFVLQGRLQTYISPDAESYIDSAKNLYLYLRGHNYRPMLMAFINGLPFLFGATSDAIFPFAYWGNLVCWLGFLLLLFEILKHFAKPKIAFLSALPCVFLVGINAMVFELATEIIFLFFAMAALYFLTRYYQTEQFKFLCLGLSVLVLSMLVKPGSKFFAILLTLYFIKPIVFNFASRYAWLIYASYFAVLVQCAGMKYQFGNFTISYIDAVTYYDYLGARAESLQSGKPFKQVWLERAIYIYSKPCPEQKQIAKADFLHQLQSNTLGLIRAYGINLVENSTTGSIQIELMKNVKQTDYFSKYKTLVYSMSKWQNRMGTLLGILLSVWAILRFRNKQNPLAIVGALVLYTMLLSGISCSEGDRFHVILFPLVMVLVAKWMVERKKVLASG